MGREAVGPRASSFTETYNTGNIVRQIAAQILKDEVESLNPKFRIDIRDLQWSSFLQMSASTRARCTPWPGPSTIPIPTTLRSRSWRATAPTRSATASATRRGSAGAARRGGLRSAARRAIYQQLTKLAYTDAPGIYVAQPTGFPVMRSWVRGWYYNAVITQDYYPLSKQ